MSLEFSIMTSHKAGHLYAGRHAAPGTALSIAGKTPVFTPLKIRGLELHNRFAVSPMGTFSAVDGHLTDFHLVHLGSFALRGAALIMVEATSVTPNGRISPEDSGLWKDSQVSPLARIVEFIHSQGQKVAIQLCHSGRKASMLAPWFAARDIYAVATEEHGGWPGDLWAPSAVPYTEHHPTPQAMTQEQIELVIQKFAEASKRAVLAGVGKIPLTASNVIATKLKIQQIWLRFMVHMGT
jgi:2,4-dienoyl-CoA reductase-like NADH-dependent reductase (Old Yellow Enzyme family)